MPPTSSNGNFCNNAMPWMKASSISLSDKGSFIRALVDSPQRFSGFVGRFPSLINGNQKDEMKYEACSIPEQRPTRADKHAHAYVD